MKKFFKFGSSKKIPSNLQRATSPHRRSLVSIGSTVSGSESVGWGSFSSNVDAIRGYQIDPSRDKSLTKLHKACWTGDLDKVKKHIKKIDINQVDAESRTPLHLAAARAHKDVIWFLLGSKAKPNLPDIDGNTPLLKAVQCGHADIVQFLLERGAHPKVSDLNGNTGLHHVACNGQQDIAFSLIQKGADINAQNEEGATPLMISTIHRQVDIAELLLRHGASLSVFDKEQKTCLMVACEKGYNELVQIYLQHGVDENAENNEGYTAEDMAKFAGHDECINTLREFRLQRRSSKKSQREHQMNKAKVPSNDFHSESDEQSRISQVDLNADFNDSDHDSWNDDASETSIKNGNGIGIDLFKFLANNSDLSHTSDDVLEDNHLESLNVSQGMNALKNGKDEPTKAPEKDNSCKKTAVKNGNNELGDASEKDESCEKNGVSLDVPLVYDNGGDAVLQKSAMASANISDSVLKKDRDFLADLGLSDVSEVSTPTFSGFSIKDDAHKDADTDAEDEDINDDHQLAVAVESKEMPMKASLLNASTEKYIDTKAVDSSSSENENLPIKESNALLTRASQNLGSLQTVYMSVQKDGSFNGGGSDTDWDDESENSNTNGPVHIHPILLQKMPKEEPCSNKTFQEDRKNIQVDAVLHDQSLSLVNVNGPSEEQIAKEQTLEKTNTLLLDNSKNLSSNGISSEGTLGRPGTMHEVEEMWVKNPSVEIAKDAITSTPVVNEEAQPIVAKEAQSMVEDLAEDVDNIYYAQLALVNSQETSRSNTLDGQQTGNFSHTTHCNVENVENPEAIPLEQLWAHIWLQICGTQTKINDTESSDEISSVAITDPENRDSSFSSADVDQSVASTQDDIPPYQLLTSVLKDPNYSRRVIDLIQHLRLNWKKEQDKTKILIQKIKLLKCEAQKTVDKNRSLNVSKFDTESVMQRLEADLESTKHALKIQENVRADVELELDRHKIQLLTMEEKLLQEVAARQQAELLAKANQDEAKIRQELMINLSTQASSNGASLDDFGCQTDESPLEENELQALKLVSLMDEKEKLGSELIRLKQQVDSLTLSQSQRNNQQTKLKNQLETLQIELILKEKDLTRLNESLAECKRDYSVKLVGEEMLTKRLEELHEDYMSTSSKIITSEEKNGKLSMDLAIARNNLEECNLKIVLLEKEIQTVKAKDERLQISLETQRNENDQQKQEIINLQNRLTHLQSDHSKVKFELDNSAKLQQLVLDQEMHQQMIKSKEEKYIAIVNENEVLKHQIEEIQELQMLSEQKVNLLTEKLLHANTIKTEVSDLQSQLAVANSKSNLAEVKMLELKKKLHEEQTAGLRFLTVESDLEDTRNKLDLANNTITTIEKLLAVAQENERRQENQLQNELEGTMVQLRVADNKIKELGIELDKKDKIIQDLTLRLEHHIKAIDVDNPTISSPVQDQKGKRLLFGKNVEDGNFASNCSLKGSEIESANNLLEDSAATNQEWQSIRDCMLPSLMFSKYNATLDQLQKQVDELKKQSVEGKKVPHNDQNVSGSSRTDDQQPGHISVAEPLNYQINSLGEKLQEERHQKEEYEVQIKEQKQQLAKANGLLKHALQMQNFQNRFDESANKVKNSIDEVDLEYMRHSWEVGARRELNQQLDKINKFLEERSQANDHLEQLHKEREIRLHNDYQRAIRDLRFEVRQLHEELHEKESTRKALEEQNQHRRKLNDARKRVKAKLWEHPKEKISKHGKHLYANHPSRSKDVLFTSSTPEYASTSLTTLQGMSPSMSGSPIINNLKSFKDLESALSVKLGFDQDPIVQQLSGSAALDSLYKSNLNLSLEKTTSEYLDALKKNYLL